MLQEVILPSASVDKILKCDHSVESNGAVLSCGAVYHAVQGGSFETCDSAEVTLNELELEIAHEP